MKSGQNPDCRERTEVRKLGLVIPRGQRIEVDDTQELHRPGQIERSVVQRGLTGYTLQTDLRDQRERAGFVFRWFKYRAQADTGNILREQQPTLQRDGIDDRIVLQ